jgi:cytoskeleton protein RodZ
LTEQAASVTGVGAELARARQAQGLAIGDVAQQLKFAPRQLEALEAERFADLPGATIARGMLRNYARLLKLDPEPLVERVAQRLGPLGSDHLAERFRQPVPFTDGSRRATVAYLALSVVVLAVVAGLGYQWHQERTTAQRLPFVKADPGATPAAQTASVAPAAAAEPVPQKIEEKAVDKPAEKVAEKPLAEKPLQKPVAQKPLTPGVHRIVIRCEQDAWVEVTDGMGRNLVSSLNPAGSERVVQARGPFELVIGNARNVRLTLDDRPIDLARHIGRHSDVARLKLP